MRPQHAAASEEVLTAAAVACAVQASSDIKVRFVTRRQAAADGWSAGLRERILKFFTVGKLCSEESEVLKNKDFATAFLLHFRISRILIFLLVFS